MGALMETMAEQYKGIAKAERVNVYFYDNPRRELYKRLKEEDREIVKGK